MALDKKLLEPFTEKELMTYIDIYVETGSVPVSLPGHTEEECSELAKFFGFGYVRQWTEQELSVLYENYSRLGPEGTAALLTYRTERDCRQKAGNLGLRTSVRKPRNLPAPDNWMIWETEILHKYYPVIGTKVAALLPNRTESACGGRARKENLTIKHPVRWNQEEDEILRKFYPKLGSDVCLMLESKSPEAVASRTLRLGISGPSSAWTPAEDQILLLHYPEMGAKVAELFRGVRSRSACTARARELGITYSHTRDDWSGEELAILREHYPTMAGGVSDLLPGRDAASCWKKAARLGITFRKRREEGADRPERQNSWTEEEETVFRKNYPYMGYSVSALLPGRTRIACANHARKLGLYVEKPIFWTKEEDEILRRFYPTEGERAFSRLPNRTRSACTSRASRLGLSRSTHMNQPALKGRGIRRCGNPTKKDVGQRRYILWTAEEDAVLQQFYQAEGAAVAERLSGRTCGACEARASILGLRQGKASRWSEDEDQTIRKYYPEEGVNIVHRLRGRSVTACMSRASKLKVRSVVRKSNL